MIDIKTIPEIELRKDLRESNIDILVCKSALRGEVMSYSGGSVADRLKANKHFVIVITAELERRKKKRLGLVNQKVNQSLAGRRYEKT